jgi:hypothetical protein
MSADKQISEMLKRLERLEKATFGTQHAEVGRKSPRHTTPSKPIKIDFELNERNFVKTYAKGMSGPKKFTRLLAFIVKGKVGETVEVSLIRSKWNKMKANNLLGYAFNVNYPNSAKTSGWVDPKKYGTYCLSNSWMQIF